MQETEETRVLGLGRAEPLEKEMTTPSSILLSWRSPWTEEPGWATVHRVAKSQTRLKWPSTLSTDACVCVPESLRCSPETLTTFC